MLKNASTMLNNKYLNNNKNKFKIEYIFDRIQKKYTIYKELILAKLLNLKKC